MTDGTGAARGPDLASLVAIDVHTHVHRSGWAPASAPAGESLAAMATYFKTSAAGYTVDDLASHYRERKMAAVTFTVAVATATILADGLSVVGKTGTVALTSIAPVGLHAIELPMFQLKSWQKRIVGCPFGNASPHADIPKLLRLYRQGDLMLDELVTRTYRLRDVNEGYADMRAHRNVRGVISYP